MDIIQLDSCHSTNTWVKEQLDQLDLNNILCVTTNEQTGGRGRLSRSWVSPRDVNLYATFVFKLQENPPIHLAQIISISCAHILKNLGLSPQIKWPNDILLNGKKCAGVLCEVQGGIAILGIGLNINMEKSLCAKIDQPATSILVETNKEHSVTAILKDLATQFEQNLKVYFEKGFEPFSAFYNAHLSQKGQTIECMHQGKSIHGVLKGATSDGFLELTLENGQTIKTAEYLGQA